jgi:glycosyltransferase involved in cell wall biosynthesis
MTGLISVIIPVYNAERYLAEAIESVMSQTLPPDEIIIVDDGSTDESHQVAKRFAKPVLYYYQSQAGPGAARNLGVALAKGDWLTFLDADDLWLPDKLARQMDLLKLDKELEMVFGGVEQFISPDLDEFHRPNLRIQSQTFKGYHVGTMIIRRAAFAKVGFFSTALRVGEFIDWFARTQEKGLKSRLMPEIVMRRRIHDNNLMQREGNIGGDYARILKKALQRRRVPKE